MNAITAQIEQIQPDCWLKLLSEPIFGPVAIFKIREKRPADQINKALATAGGGRTYNGTAYAGATVEVLMPTLKNATPDTPGPVCMLEQKFIVLENPVINLGATGTKLTAEVIAVQIIQTLQLYFFGGLPTGALNDGTGGGVQTFFAGQAFYNVRDAGPGSSLVMIEVTLQVKVGLTPLQRTTMPQISCPEQTVTLTDMQPYSAMWYTTDGSFPGPGNVGQTVDGITYGPAILYNPLGPNLITGSPTYGAEEPTYTLTGLTPGASYLWTPGANDTEVYQYNGEQFLTSQGIFIPSGTTATLVGQLSSAVTATVQLISLNPFTVASGTTVRVAAYAAGLQGSLVDTFYVT